MERSSRLEHRARGSLMPTHGVSTLTRPRPGTWARHARSLAARASRAGVRRAALSFSEMKAPAHRKLSLRFRRAKRTISRSSNPARSFCTSLNRTQGCYRTSRARAIMWIFAALNTVEPPIVEFSLATILKRACRQRDPNPRPDRSRTARRRQRSWIAQDVGLELSLPSAGRESATNGMQISSANTTKKALCASGSHAFRFTNMSVKKIGRYTSVAIPV